jgi:hypothetical protein
LAGVEKTEAVRARFVAEIAEELERNAQQPK